MADDRRCPCVSGHITLARLSTGGDSGSAKIRAACETPRRQRPRAGSSAGRLGRSRATRSARPPHSRRAHRICAARHVRCVLRRNRLYHWPLPNCGEATGKPGPPPCAGSGQGSRLRSSEQREVVSAFLTALRAGDFEGLIAVLDPDVVVRADSTTVPPGAPTEIRSARTWAKGAIAFSQLVHSAPPMLVDGAVGLVWAPGGRLSRVLRFTIARGKIAQVEIIADPARLRDLDLAVIKE
jgi:ketosteroid isomerase-like protein